MNRHSSMSNCKYCICGMLTVIWLIFVVTVTYRMLQSDENDKKLLEISGIRDALFKIQNKSVEGYKQTTVMTENVDYNDTKFTLQIKKKLSEVMVKEKENTAQVKQAVTGLQQSIATITNMRQSLDQIKEALVYMRDVSSLYKNDYDYEARRKWMEGHIQNFKEGKSFLKQPSKFLLIDDIDIDPKVHYKMIVMVFSHSEENYERRASIRKHWGNSSIWKTKEKFKVVFMLGGIHERSMMKKVYDESKLHRDILVESVPEGYFTTSSKLAICLHWLSLQDLKYDFVFKADDDVFVNIDNAIKKVSTTDHRQSHYYGSINKNPRAFRDGRYKITKIEHPPDGFVDFVPGAAVIMTKVLLMKIAPYFNFVNPMKLEDVYLSQLINKYGGTIAVKSAGFKLDGGSCASYTNGMVAIHPVKSRECMENMAKEAWKEKKLYS